MCVPELVYCSAQLDVSLTSASSTLEQKFWCSCRVFAIKVRDLAADLANNSSCHLKGTVSCCNMNCYSIQNSIPRNYEERSTERQTQDGVHYCARAVMHLRGISNKEVAESMIMVAVLSGVVDSLM